jgi:Ser/Thr protein kinase RdoA (MazF antagonist)
VTTDVATGRPGPTDEAAAIERALGASVPSGGPFRLVRRRIAAYSRIYVFRPARRREAEFTAAGVVVKVFTGDARSLAGQQFETLRTLWPAFADLPDAAVARPLALLDGLDALVLEEVPGAPLQALFTPALWLPVSGRRAVVVEGCRRAGAWLRRLHDATRVEPAPLDVSAKLTALPDCLARLEAHGLPGTVLRAVESHVRDAAARLEGRILAAAMVHGDFTLDNVWFAGGRTFGLDIDGRWRNAVYHDLASFLNSLDLVRLSRAVPRTVIDACGAAFRAGYGEEEAGDSARPALRFLRPCGLLAVAVELLERRRHQPLRRAWIRRFAAATLERVLRDGGSDAR